MITAFVRTIILYFLIVVGMRLMGKRQIGELEPSELVLTMMISDLAAVPMQDFGIPLLSGDPDAAGPVTAAESAVSPQPAAAGADLRDAHGPDPGRQAAAGRHAEEPLYHR